MLAIILMLFMIWLLFKLGIGFIKIIAFLLFFGIIAIFFAYLLIPLLVIALIIGLIFAVLR